MDGKSLDITDEKIEQLKAIIPEAFTEDKINWALIKKNEKTVYFVAETKSKGQELKTSEKRKIKCGYAHFKEFDDVKYRQVATVGELDDETISTVHSFCYYIRAYDKSLDWIQKGC